LSRPDDLLAAAEAAAPIPRDPDGSPVFAEPWQAQAFALTLALHERGLFDWSEWTQALGAEIHRGGAGEPGEDYFRCWLAATERLAAAKGATTPAELASRREAWDRAAHATPHGEPIVLERDPLRPRHGPIATASGPSGEERPD
jgi:nitrile hydratase accessory protein